MEPAAASNFQLANSWTMKPPAAWPPAGFPVESDSTEIYGNCIQTCVPNTSGGGQLVEYYAAATQHYPNAAKEAQEELCDGVVLHNTEMEIYKANPIRLFEKVAQEFEEDTDMMKMKIHRYPESIRDLGDRYTVPRVVAIGPYHQSRQQLKKAEQAKHVAAYHCIRKSECSVQEMYDAVVSAADGVRHLYDEDVMADISYDDFRVMMFYDACFLVQYMVWFTKRWDVKETDPSLRSFIYSHLSGINHDIWLLENQLPWRVVEAVMRFRPVNLHDFVASWRGRLQDRQSQSPKEKGFDWDNSYNPPHLLGLLRHYLVGSRKETHQTKKESKSISFSVSAIELAQMGTTFNKQNETEELANTSFNKGTFFPDLSLAPLSLNYARASRLVNMEAFELCVTPNFAANCEDSAVCSYLLLLCMLVHREEDVHELRRQGVLQGGAGLTNKQALDFFTSFQSLPTGLCYTSTMIEIQRYRDNRNILDKGYTFCYKNKKTIRVVLSISVAVVSIFAALFGILLKLI